MFLKAKEEVIMTSRIKVKLGTKEFQFEPDSLYSFPVRITNVCTLEEFDSEKFWRTMSSSSRKIVMNKALVVYHRKNRKLYVQKHNTTFELAGFDREKDSADFKIDLGNLNVNDEMSLDDFINKLENVLKLLKKHKGDVFVVQ